MSDFGNYIKELRTQKNMSACKLAKVAGLSTTAISRIENRERQTPSVSTVYKLSKALDVDVRELVEMIANQE